MSNIFISYAREDRNWSKRLAEALEHQKWTIWWDRDIPVGKSFDQVIEEALDSAKCVIVLWSKNSVASDWVKNEASEGAKRRILVPVLIENVKIPLEFRRIQTADFSDWDGSPDHPEFENLLAAISSILGPPSETETAKAESGGKPKDESAKQPGWLQEHLKAVMFSGLGVAALALVAIAVIYYPPGPKPELKPPEPSRSTAITPKPSISPTPLPAPLPQPSPTPQPQKDTEGTKQEIVLPQISPKPLLPEAQPEFPRKWRVEWRGGRSNALYTGSLSIDDKINDQTYTGLLLVKTPQGNEVSQDALVSIDKSKVKIKCSNPSLRTYPADNFSLDLSGNTMKGIDKDVKGNIGLGVIFTAVDR